MALLRMLIGCSLQTGEANHLHFCKGDDPNMVEVEVEVEEEVKFSGDQEDLEFFP